MTDKEIESCYTALGKAFAERRDLTKRVEKLRQRLDSFQKAIEVLLENPYHEESNKTVDSYDCDPREDWHELKEGRSRLGELSKILSE